MPVAAIESLVELLAHSQASTISETLDLLARSTAHLKSQIANSISLSAGTDLFQRYLINALQRPNPAAGGPAGEFKNIRQHLISNGRLFVTRAKASRDKIAAFGKHFVRDGNTILTNGGSRVVGALLRHATEDSDGSVRFRVIYVLNGQRSTAAGPSENFRGEGRGRGRGGGPVAKSAEEAEGEDVVRSLRKHGVPVAVIGEGAVAYAMGTVDKVIVGAEGVVENGGIISRLGTYQLGLLAKAARKPFYVVAESHKFVRLYPLGQYDLPIEQNVIVFKTDGRRGGRGPDGDVIVDGGKTDFEGNSASAPPPFEDYFSSKTTDSIKDAVDFTVIFLSISIIPFTDRSIEGSFLGGMDKPPHPSPKGPCRSTKWRIL